MNWVQLELDFGEFLDEGLIALLIERQMEGKLKYNAIGGYCTFPLCTCCLNFVPRKHSKLVYFKKSCDKHFTRYGYLDKEQLLEFLRTL